MKMMYFLPIIAIVAFGCTNTKLERGYRWYKRGAPAHAIVLFNEYIHEVDNKLPKDRERLALTYFYRGLCNGDLNRDEMARRDYAIALELYPRFLYAAFNLGVEYMKIGDLQSAESMMSKSWDILKGVHLGMPEDVKLINKASLKKDKAYLFLYYGMLLLLKNDNKTFMSIHSAIDADGLGSGNKDAYELYDKGPGWFYGNKQKMIFEGWYFRTFGHKLHDQGTRGGQ